MSGRRWRLIALAGVLGFGPRAAASTVTPDPIATAIERAVRSRVGKDVTVSIANLSGVRVVASQGAIVAQPGPSARIGEPVRFVLFGERVGKPQARIGEATAVVNVVADVVKTSRAVSRGDRLSAGDVAVVGTDLKGWPLGALPPLDEVIGSRAKRDIGAETVLARGDIAPDPLVRAGDTVRVHVRVGDVEVLGEMVAVESGVRDAVIRLVNQETRHATRARVIGRGEVEVVNVR